MKHNRLLLLSILALAACQPNPGNGGESARKESDAKYVGQAVGNFEASEWYPGGQLGTTENIYASSYEDPTPAVTAQGLDAEFNHGEMFFERNVKVNTVNNPFGGLGPAAVRKSCLDCHPAYGHGKRQTEYVANGSKAFGNGYLLVVYQRTGENNNPHGDYTNDGPYVAEVTGMPQTMANEPFLPPIDEKQITINWHTVTTMPSGLPMKFDDGETFSLIYPEVLIPESAYNTNPTPHATAKAAGTQVGYRLESTIGVIGSGIIDAIDQDDIREQYRAEAAQGAPLNPAFWDAAANDFAASAYYHNWQKGSDGDGYDADGNFYARDTYKDGKLLKKFTYAMTRGTLQDGAGANAIWNITNVSRPDRRYLYTTPAWAKAMSENPEVIARIRAQGASSPYYCDVDGNGAVTDGEIAEAVNALLSPSTDQFNNPYHNFTPEMSADDFYDFMVWHRGLAIPRARNLNDKAVQRGKEVFMELGCASCHRPKWQTRSDNYWAPAMNGTKPLPRYANQTIYPYSDFIQHRLFMVNDIHGTWCRTTPLWGRGLSLQNTGAGDRLHDCRARNTLEAIMWHAYSDNSEALWSARKVYDLSKEDRDALVKFIDSI